jgi:hypothetical protein
MTLLINLYFMQDAVQHCTLLLSFGIWCSNYSVMMFLKIFHICKNRNSDTLCV